MTDELTHRALAAAAFNATWDLLERDRTPHEDLELLDTAFASRHHWRAEGGAPQLATADWMVSRCFAALGDGAMALRFAHAAFEHEPDGGPAWRRASLYEGLARAHAAAGDAEGRAEAVQRATAALAEEGDADDRALIAEQLASVPEAS